MLVTLVGCSCSRSPITRIGRLAAAGERQQHQRLVAGEGQPVRAQAPSTAESRICCTRMTLVTAAMVRAGPIRSVPQLRRPHDRVERQRVAGVMTCDASSADRARRATRPARTGAGCGHALRLQHRPGRRRAPRQRRRRRSPRPCGWSASPACPTRPPRCSPRSRPRPGTRGWRWSNGGRGRAGRAPRVSLVLKADIRPGHTGQLTAKVERVEQALRDGGPEADERGHRGG